jgi:hypothetical protein
LLERHTNEVQSILIIGEVLHALHRHVHNLIQDGRAKPRGREKGREESINSLAAARGGGHQLSGSAEAWSCPEYPKLSW